MRGLPGPQLMPARPQVQHSLGAPKAPVQKSQLAFIESTSTLRPLAHVEAIQGKSDVLPGSVTCFSCLAVLARAAAAE